MDYVSPKILNDNNYLIGLEIVMIEELQRVRKTKNMPQEIKAKRKAFNNKRVHTMPSDTTNLQKLNPYSRMQCLTQRCSRDVIKQVLTKTMKSERKKASERRGIKLENFWQSSGYYEGLKACKKARQGYAKRQARVDSNNQSIGLLFRDSTRLRDNRQNLHKNILMISSALRNSFPKLQLDNHRTDESLRVNREEFRNIFSSPIRARFL